MRRTCKTLIHSRPYPPTPGRVLLAMHSVPAILITSLPPLPQNTSQPQHSPARPTLASPLSPFFLIPAHTHDTPTHRLLLQYLAPLTTKPQASASFFPPWMKKPSSRGAAGASFVCVASFLLIFVSSVDGSSALRGGAGAGEVRLTQQQCVGVCDGGVCGMNHQNQESLMMTRARVCQP